MHAATLRATAIVLAAGALVVTALEATLLSRYGATWITLGNLGVHVAVTGALAVRHDLPRVSTAVTVIALGLPSIFGGAIITEQVFKVNGLGQLLIMSIHANDMPMTMTLTFIFAILIVVFTLIADVLYGVLDPRIRYD